MSRISVIRDKRIVPLLPGKPATARVLSPSSGLIVEKHRMPAIEIPEHEHSTLCLHMQTSAPVQMEWWSEGKNGREQPGPGSLILLAPGTRDRLRWDRPSERVVVSIDEQYLSRAAQELGRKHPVDFRNRWMLRDRQLQLLLTEFQREMDGGWRTGSLYGDLLGMSISVALIQNHASETRRELPVSGGMTGARLNRVLEYIHENSHADLRLENLAAVADMSLFHFARSFRATTGVSPHRYLLDQRLQNAKLLLQLNSRSVAEVAAESGFSSAGQFARAFRKHFGMSPTEWAARRS